jgi:hypothetical protein
MFQKKTQKPKPISAEGFSLNWFLFFFILLCRRIGTYFRIGFWFLVFFGVYFVGLDLVTLRDIYEYTPIILSGRKCQGSG